MELEGAVEADGLSGVDASSLPAIMLGLLLSSKFLRGIRKNLGYMTVLLTSRNSLIKVNVRNKLRFILALWEWKDRLGIPVDSEGPQSAIYINKVCNERHLNHCVKCCRFCILTIDLPSESLGSLSKSQFPITEVSEPK